MFKIKTMKISEIEGELGDAKTKYSRDPGSEKGQEEKQHNSSSATGVVYGIE